MPFFIKASTVDQYRRGLRQPARGLWNGQLSLTEFIVRMQTAIRLGISRAINAQLERFGYKWEDLTEVQHGRIRQMIAKEQGYIEGLGIFIIENGRSNGGKLRTVYARLETWIQRVFEAEAMALSFVEADPPIEWVWSPEKEHCDSCRKLNGKVKKKSWWIENGIIPAVAGAHYLECGGWRCGCRLLPTNKPLSRGPMPSLP